MYFQPTSSARAGSIASNRYCHSFLAQGPEGPAPIANSMPRQAPTQHLSSGFEDSHLGRPECRGYPKRWTEDELDRCVLDAHEPAAEQHRQALRVRVPQERLRREFQRSEWP